MSVQAERDERALHATAPRVRQQRSPSRRRPFLYAHEHFGPAAASFLRTRRFGVISMVSFLAHNNAALSSCLSDDGYTGRSTDGAG